MISSVPVLAPVQDLVATAPVAVVWELAVAVVWELTVAVVWELVVVAVAAAENDRSAQRKAQQPWQERQRRPPP
jgi:hypothetical protein